MVKTRVVEFVACVAVAAAVYAENPEVKVTRGRAPEKSGEELRCRVAMDENRYAESLSAAKWTETTPPTIDWASQVAIIIAPRLYLENYRPAFVSLRNEGEKVILEWTLREEAPDLVEETSGPGVSTHGSTAIGPEILVVAVPRTAVESKKVSCKGPKRKE